MRRLFIPLLLLLTAQTSAFPPGTFQSRQALDGTTGGGGSSYIGPGDLVTGWLQWGGLRAFSAAKAGTKAVRVCNAADANCADVLTSAVDGTLNMATITGAPLSCTTNVCTVQTLYDQSGTTRCSGPCDLIQATIANRPKLKLNCKSTLPCIEYAGVANQTLASAIQLGTTYVAPFSMSIVMNRTSQASSVYDIYSTGSTPELFGWVSADTLAIYAGDGFTQFTATDAAWHAINIEWNATTPTGAINVDGTLSDGAGNVHDLDGGPGVTLGVSSNNPPFMQAMEAGFTSSPIKGTIATNLCHNQRLFWTTGGSC